MSDVSGGEVNLFTAEEDRHNSILKKTPDSLLTYSLKIRSPNGEQGKEKRYRRRGVIQNSKNGLNF